MAEEKQSLAQKTENDLEKSLVEKKKQLFEETVTLTQGKIKDVHKPRKIRKEIARLKTLLRRKELTSK